MHAVLCFTPNVRCSNTCWYCLRSQTVFTNKQTKPYAQIVLLCTYILWIYTFKCFYVHSLHVCAGHRNQLLWFHHVAVVWNMSKWIYIFREMKIETRVIYPVYESHMRRARTHTNCWQFLPLWRQSRVSRSDFVRVQSNFTRKFNLL